MAVADELINKPGDRLPMTYGGEDSCFSGKYFIKKTKESSGLWFYLHVEYCPSCGEKTT